MSDTAEPDWAKVEYVTTHGHKSRAYIDMNTGYGEDKYTDEAVRIIWVDTAEQWLEVTDVP